MDQVSAMKDAVLHTALTKCKTGNFTTVELKKELIEKFPQYHWRHDTGIICVTGLVNDLVKEGSLICTEGVFCDPTATPAVIVPKATSAPVATVAVKATGKGTGKKRGSYMTQAKRAALAATITPATIATVVSTPATKTHTPKVEVIGKGEAAKKIQKSKGGFGYVVFKKKDNTIREMYFKRIPKETGSNLGYIRVTDIALYCKSQALLKSKADCFKDSIKTINFQEVRRLVTDGHIYRVV